MDRPSPVPDDGHRKRPLDEKGRMNDSGPPAADPVNMKVVLEIFNDNRELLGRFFKDFMVNSLETLAEIRKAVEEKDPDQVRRSAHKLKGSLKYLAAGKSVDCAGSLEEMGRQGKLEKADEAYRDLAEAYEEVRRFISTIHVTDL